MLILPRRFSLLSRSSQDFCVKCFSTNKGIFVPSKAWPAVTKAGHPCKICASQDKNHFCLQHGHLGIKELVDIKSRGYFVPNKCWPAKTAKNEDCKQCAKFTTGYFCHHHKTPPIVAKRPSPPPLLRSMSLSSLAIMHRSPRFYEIAAISVVATDFASKTICE